MKKSLNRLQVALDTAEDHGAAFEDASRALATLESDLMSSCAKLDSEMQGVCEAQVARQWQARSVKFTLDYKSDNFQFVAKKEQYWRQDTKGEWKIFREENR